MKRFNQRSLPLLSVRLYNSKVFIVIFAVLSICSCRHVEKKSEVKVAPGVAESTIIIDGRSVKGWEITNFGPQGPVYLSGEKIILGCGDGCTGINWKGDFPAMDYEVNLEAMSVDGNDFFCGMTFPVANEPCTLIIGGWGGTTVGLSSINGMDASENETTTLHSFEKNRWYTIRLKVTSLKIEAFIDSLEVVNFSKGNKRLSVRPEVELSRPFGITSWKTTAAIRNIKVNTITK